MRGSAGASVALALGVIAMVAVPLSFAGPPGPSVIGYAGIAAAIGAFFLGRGARATGDRSTGAVWAPRLGAAALMGYLLGLASTLV